MIKKKSKALALFCILAQCYTCSLIEASNNKWIVEIMNGKNKNDFYGFSFKESGSRTYIKPEDSLSSCIEMAWQKEYKAAFRISFGAISPKSRTFLIHNKYLLYLCFSNPFEFKGMASLSTWDSKINYTNFKKEKENLIVSFGDKVFEVSYNYSTQKIEFNDYDRYKNSWIIEITESNNKNSSCAYLIPQENIRRHEENLKDKLAQAISKQTYKRAFRISYRKISNESIIFLVDENEKIILYNDGPNGLRKLTIDNNVLEKIENCHLDEFLSDMNFYKRNGDLIIYLGAKTNLKASYDSKKKTIQLENDIEPHKEELKNKWIVQMVLPKDNDSSSDAFHAFSVQGKQVYLDQDHYENGNIPISIIKKKLGNQSYLAAFRVSKNFSTGKMVFIQNKKLYLYKSNNDPEMVSTIDNFNKRTSWEKFEEQNGDLIISLGGETKLRASYDSENESIQLEDDIEPKKIKKQAPNSSPTEKKFFANYWRYILSLIVVALTAGAGYYWFFYSRKG